MKKNVEIMLDWFVNEQFCGLLEGLDEIKKSNYIIFDDDGCLINGRWSNKVYCKQNPGIRRVNDEYYAVYDNRYCQSDNIVKMYSEFMHEIFHCYQMRKGFHHNNTKIILEGTALLFEIIIFSNYTKVPILKILSDYGNAMNEEKYGDYFHGAVFAYEKLIDGKSWEEILNDE